ncbi:hypothetical protein B0H14DRAFT_3673759 [Mycena olivaceomarginata]|nr:hypothetical protein B0H14DRAFT_3673759 [Mycena olivaceomarginata]
MPIFFVPDDTLEKYLAAVDAFADNTDIPGAFLALGPHLQSQKSLDHLFSPPTDLCLHDESLSASCSTQTSPTLGGTPWSNISTTGYFPPKILPLLLFCQPREDLREETPLSPLQSPLSPISYPELNENENTCSGTGQCTSAGYGQPLAD